MVGVVVVRPNGPGRAWAESGDRARSSCLRCCGSVDQLPSPNPPRSSSAPSSFGRRGHLPLPDRGQVRDRRWRAGPCRPGRARRCRSPPRRPWPGPACRRRGTRRRPDGRPRPAGVRWRSPVAWFSKCVMRKSGKRGKREGKKRKRGWKRGLVREFDSSSVKWVVGEVDQQADGFANRLQSTSEPAHSAS